jgi:hypothetical protein
MRNITLLGDSNFVGEWNRLPKADEYKIPQYGPGVAELTKYLGKFNLPYNYGVSHPGISYFLEKRGYRVSNLALGGDSNLLQLVALFESLGMSPQPRSSRTPFPDVIVWCITEPFRDLYEYNGPEYCMKFQQYIKNTINLTEQVDIVNREILKISFDFAEAIHKLTKIPFLIVEGQSTTLELDNQYTFIKGKISKWIPGILGLKKPPIACTLRTYETIEKYLGKNKSETILDSYSDFLNRINEKKVDFPDGGHPSAQQHRLLSDKLHRKLRNYNTVKRPDHIQESSLLSSTE